MSNVYRYRWGPRVDLTVAKTGTVAIEQGDMVKKVGTNGRVQAVSAANDSTALLGVAMKASPTTDPTATKLRVLSIEYGTVFEMPIASSAKLKFGQPLKLSGAQELTVYGTAGTNLNVSSTNVVAIVAQDMDATASSCLVKFLGSKFSAQITNAG